MEMWPVGPVRFLLEVAMNIVLALVIGVVGVWFSLGAPNVFAKGGAF